MVNIIRLRKELHDAGFQGEVAVLDLDADRTQWNNAIVTWHPRTEKLVRLDWPSTPSQAMINGANNIVQAHVGDSNLEEKLDKLTLPQRLLSANVRATQLIWEAMPANIRPELPQWVIDVFQEARNKIENEGG